MISRLLCHLINAISNAARMINPINMAGIIPFHGTSAVVCLKVVFTIGITVVVFCMTELVLVDAATPWVVIGGKAVDTIVCCVTLIVEDSVDALKEVI